MDYQITGLNQKEIKISAIDQETIVATATYGYRAEMSDCIFFRGIDFANGEFNSRLYRELLHISIECVRKAGINKVLTKQSDSNPLYSKIIECLNDYGFVENAQSRLMIYSYLSLKKSMISEKSAAFTKIVEESVHDYFALPENIRMKYSFMRTGNYKDMYPDNWLVYAYVEDDEILGTAAFYQIGPSVFYLDDLYVVDMIETNTILVIMMAAIALQVREVVREAHLADDEWYVAMPVPSIVSRKTMDEIWGNVYAEYSMTEMALCFSSITVPMTIGIVSRMRGAFATKNIDKARVLNKEFANEQEEIEYFVKKYPGTGMYADWNSFLASRRIPVDIGDVAFNQNEDKYIGERVKYKLSKFTQGDMVCYPRDILLGLASDEKYDVYSFGELKKDERKELIKNLIPSDTCMSSDFDIIKSVCCYCDGETVGFIPIREVSFDMYEIVGIFISNSYVEYEKDVLSTMLKRVSLYEKGMDNPGIRILYMISKDKKYNIMSDVLGIGTMV